jgi:hypothetical protein
MWGKWSELEPEFFTSWSRSRTKMDRLRNTAITDLRSGFEATAPGIDNEIHVIKPKHTADTSVFYIEQMFIVLGFLPM